ncbi:hypothetical protein CHUAL_008091 [Chamberlinius hualienensis]
MNFGVNCRKRHQLVSLDGDVDKSGQSNKKAKIELAAKVSGTSLVDCLDVEISVGSRSSSPVLFDMEEDKLTRPLLRTRPALSENKNDKDDSLWSIPEDVLTYKQTKQTIDPWNFVIDVEEKPLVVKRHARARQGLALDYNRLRKLPFKEASQIILADFDLIKVILNIGKKSSSTWKWAKPLIGGTGSLGNIERDSDATLPEQDTVEVEPTVDGNENIENEIISTPDLGECSSCLPTYQASVSDDNSVSNRQSGFELKIDTDSDSDFKLFEAKPKKKKGKSKAKIATKQQLNVEPRSTRSLLPIQNDFSVFTPVAGKKLYSRFRDQDLDEYDFETDIVKTTALKRPTKTYSEAISGSKEEPINSNQIEENKTNVECPMCGKSFKLSVIEEHAYDCQG